MAAAIRRPLRGSRVSSFYPIKNLPSLSSLDSAFQLQEYISLLIRLDVHDVDAIVSLPGKAKEKDSDSVEAEDIGRDETDGEKGRNEVTVDEACWIYEQLRRLAQDLTHPLITTLQQECTRASCPQMKAGEWLYLCVAHGNDGTMEQCCAIDYILHTLDSATALLNSPRAFPSRLQIPQTSHRHFTSLARRLGRIFAHAYFHHREAFEQAEAESSLYARFLALTAKFDLVPAEFLVIPTSTAFSHDEDSDSDHDRDAHLPRLMAAAVGRHPSPQREIDLSDVRPLDMTKNISPPGLGLGRGHPRSGSLSPRKFGRNRTDTMVLSDAVTLVEDLRNTDDSGMRSTMPDIQTTNVHESETGIDDKKDLEFDSLHKDEFALKQDLALTTRLPVSPEPGAQNPEVQTEPTAAASEQLAKTSSTNTAAAHSEPTVVEPDLKPSDTHNSAAEHDLEDSKPEAAPLPAESKVEESESELISFDDPVSTETASAKEIIQVDELPGEPDQPPSVDEIASSVPLKEEQQRQLLEEGEPPLSLLEPPVRESDEEPIKRSEGVAPLSLGSTLFDLPEKTVVIDDITDLVETPEVTHDTASSGLSVGDSAIEPVKEELTEVEETKAESKDQEKTDS